MPNPTGEAKFDRSRCGSDEAAYGIPTVALRYFNVYGPGQALSNPYTGVDAIFCARLLNGKAPLVNEDGNQTRDFVHVSDIVQANLLALRCSVSDRPSELSARGLVR